jgi:hypothetical protein
MISMSTLAVAMTLASLPHVDVDAVGSVGVSAGRAGMRQCLPPLQRRPPASTVLQPTVSTLAWPAVVVVQPHVPAAIVAAATVALEVVPAPAVAAPVLCLHTAVATILSARSPPMELIASSPARMEARWWRRSQSSSLLALVPVLSGQAQPAVGLPRMRGVVAAAAQRVAEDMVVAAAACHRLLRLRRMC